MKRMIWYTFLLPSENVENTKSVNINRLSFFVALCMFLSGIEYMIPKPIPFLRIGLANLPILFAVKRASFKECSFLVLLKILCQGLISGTLFSYIGLFSLCGSFFSFISMWLVFKVCGKNVSYIGMSVFGALFNNVAQLACAYFIVFGKNIVYIAPVLLISGLITSLILGIFALLYEGKSEWIVETEKEDFWNFEIDTGHEASKKTNIIANVQFFSCLLLMICFLFVKSLLIQWITIFVVLVILIIKRKGKVKLLPSLFILIFVVGFSIFTPMGKVLFEIGKQKVTLGAIQKGLFKSGLLIGMVFISQLGISKNIFLPGKIGKFTAQVFGIFNKLIVYKGFFSKGKSFFWAIDQVLMDVCK